MVGMPLGKRGDVGAGAVRRAILQDRPEDGTIERWQQPELPAWEVPKRNPHERRPRAPEWKPAGKAEIAELATERDDSAGADVAA
jgi:hypothetical protein